MDFSKAYDRQEFVSFLRDSFLPDDFQPHEENVALATQTQYTRSAVKLGTCESLDLVVYEVRHSSRNDARVGLSKEAFRMLADEMEDRALVVFVPENSNANYRFSFIEIKLELDDARVVRSFSNPRRYSFMLGEGIACFTPNKYLNEKGRVVSDDDLHSRFSVEVLTKEFYSELSDWYAWAIKIIKFPNNISTTEDDQKYNHEGAIRLITRLIFVWFLKQRGLIPWQFFDEAYLRDNLLVDFDPHLTDGFFRHQVMQTKYYRAILQNLFFAMLNCPITQEGKTELTERKFKEGRSGYDDNKRMRYKSLFSNPDMFIELANKTVPFLNGGLFDCLDDKQNGMYYDGFSERTASMEQLNVPDFLFFGEEVGKNIDLSEWYGDKNKKKVSARGIIDILKRYNFTVEENMPFDKDVSLDPELLGKVFENLLAAYNPETQQTARKQTGSFYTPREIVQYMVDESLVAHLKRAVGEEQEAEYRKLLSYSDEEISLTTAEKQQIMHSLLNCKILDPACGSGAFPVGILQQMVHILTQIDPDNSQWKEMLMEQAISETSEAYRKASSEERAEMVADIERSFDESINRPDYARKLYLIENCIFGVDIQPIAIQISKLRFFISLVVDQKINDNPADNFGIRPLPNLEAKFVAANTLIGLKGNMTLADNADIVRDTKQQLKIARHKIFSARTSRTKQKYRQQVNELRESLAQTMHNLGFVNESEAHQLAAWDMFDQNASSPFFDPDWMFGVKEGFDIVIANPPFVNANDLKKSIGERQYKELKSLYITAKGTVDYYVYFFEKGFNLLTPNGALSYITPNKYLSANYGKELRRFIINDAQIYCLTDVSRDCVFDASVYPIITFLLKSKAKDYKFISVDKNKQINNFISNQLTIFPENIWGFLLSDKYKLSLKIVKKSHNILDCCKINATSTAAEADEFHEYITQQNEGFRLINTGTIDPFVTKWGTQPLVDKGEKYLCPWIPKDEVLLGTYRYNMYRSNKIIIAKMASRLEAFLDENGDYASINTNCIHSFKIDGKLLLAWLHSRVFHYVYECYFESLKMSGGYLPFSAPYLSCMCIPNNIGSIATSVISLVNRILSAKREDSQADTTDKEREIDLLVYHLYGLTYDEVKVVAPKDTEDWLTEEKYKEYEQTN